MIWISQLSIRVLSGARVAGIALSPVPHSPGPLSLRRVPFPLPPLPPPRQQSLLFLPALRLRVATRSPYLLRVRASAEAGVWGERGGGTGGLLASWGNAATVDRPDQKIVFLPFLRHRYPLFLVVLRLMPWKKEPLGYWEPLP